MWSVYEHGPSGVRTRAWEGYTRTLLHKRCAVRATSTGTYLDYGPMARLPGVLAAVSRILGGDAVLDGALVRVNSTVADTTSALFLRRVGDGELSDEVRTCCVSDSAPVP
jgi:hypothetical protein